MSTFIDHVGNSYVEINIKEFKKWISENQQKIKNMNMKMLNNKIHWVDDSKNRFKLHLIKGNYILKRCSNDYFNDKHDFMNKLIELESKIKELNYTLENLIKSDTPDEAADPGKVGKVGTLSIKFPKV